MSRQGQASRLSDCSMLLLFTHVNMVKVGQSTPRALALSVFVAVYYLSFVICYDRQFNNYGSEPMTGWGMEIFGKF
jgi:hypothetical protein